jgi:phospholipid-binding lipoprotein MlaA
MRISAQEFRTGLLAIALTGGVLLGGCSTAPVQKGEPIPPEYSAKDILQPGVVYAASEIPDPFEGFNRTMYRFNYRFDKYIFLPAVRGYEWLVPDFFQARVHDFMNTWRRDFTTLYNSALQLSPGKTLDTAGRMLVNVTLGLLGLFDWATPMGIPLHQEDFGQTLGYWGSPAGPYLVLPILGPSSVRDGAGLGVDFLVKRETRTRLTTLGYWEWGWDILDALDTRAHVAFRYYETGSPFEYEWVKLLYTTKRTLDIEK